MTNRFKYVITADDQTAKGVSSAQKRQQGLAKGAAKISAVEKAADREKTRREERLGQLQHRYASKSHIGRATSLFGQGHNTGASIFGGSTPINRAMSHISAVRQSVSEMSESFAAARESGGALSGVLGAVGMAAGGVTGVLLAAGLAGFKFAAGWVEGGAALGRLRQSIGLATDDIQKFQAAGETVGVDKGDTAGALGGLGQTLFDERFGRNNEALAANNALGLQVKNGADGAPDVKDFALQLADAISKQKNPYTQNLIASTYGVTAMLPLLRQGRQAVQAGLDSAGKYAPIMSEKDIADATRIQRETIEGRQAVERGTQAAQGVTARAGEGGIVAGRDVARGIISGDAGRAAVAGARGAAASIAKAGVQALGGAAKFTASEVGQLGSAIGGLAERLRRAATDGEAKWHVPALLTEAQADLESGYLRHMPAGSNNPFGIKARKGEPYVTAMTWEERNGRLERVPQNFRKFDSLEEAVDAHDKLLAIGKPYRTAQQYADDPFAYANAIAPHYATDSGYAGKLDREMHLVIEMHGLPPGVHASVTSKKPGVKVVHAMQPGVLG